MNTRPSPEDLTTLRQALRLASQSLQVQQPPADLAGNIQARVRAAPSSAPMGAGTAATSVPKPARPRWAWAGAWACTLLLVGSVVLMRSGPTEPAPAATEHMAGFVPLVPQEDWPQGDAPAWLVDTELRRDRLVELGLPFDPARAGDSVRAKLLVRPSGEVLAVRFLL
jgi:hypothetical protein